MEWPNVSCWGNGEEMDEKVRDGDEDGNDIRGYERMWEIWGTTCLIGGTIPNNDIYTCWIRSHTCYIHKDKLTGISNSILSQSLRMIIPISFHLTLYCPQLYHWKRIQANAIYHYLSIP